MSVGLFHFRELGWRVKVEACHFMTFGRGILLVPPRPLSECCQNVNKRTIISPYTNRPAADMTISASLEVMSTASSSCTGPVPNSFDQNSKSSLTILVVSSKTSLLLRSLNDGAAILRCRFQSSSSVVTIFGPKTAIDLYVWTGFGNNARFEVTSC
jgi:hypothetical protein